MEGKSILAADITAMQKTAKYDAACKRLLSQKEVLAHILKGCVKEFQECSIEDIVDKYIEGDPIISDVAVAPNETNAVPSLITGMNTEDSSVNEGRVTFDILFFAVAPKSSDLIKLIINLEAQGKDDLPYDLVTRAVYYCSRLISSQYGREFQQSRYQDVKKVYSIWICTKPKRYPQNAITAYSITENAIVGNMRRKPECYDLLSIIMLNISDAIEQIDTDVIKMLSVLLSDKLLPKKRIDILEDEFALKMRDVIESESDNMCSLGQAIYEEGISVGEQRGQTRGKTLAKLDLIKAWMSEDGLSLEQAFKLGRVPEEEQAEYLAQLNLA